jgi:hypothetical protein
VITATRLVLLMTVSFCLLLCLAGFDQGPDVDWLTTQAAAPGTGAARGEPVGHAARRLPRLAYRTGDMPFPPLELVPSLAPVSIIASIGSSGCA